MRAFRLIFFLWIGFIPVSQARLSLDNDEAISHQLRKKLHGRGDYHERTIARRPERSIDFEAWISVEGDFQLLTQILGDWARYQQWALTGINRKPDGGSYLLKILRLDPVAADPSALIATVKLDLPLFGQELLCHLNMKSVKKKNVFTLLGGIEKPVGAFIETLDGALKAFPAEGDPHRVWVYAKGYARIKNWLLYEALPERLLKNESGERLQTVIENYQREEARQLERKRLPAAKSSRETESLGRSAPAEGRR